MTEEHMKHDKYLIGLACTSAWVLYALALGEKVWSLTWYHYNVHRALDLTLRILSTWSTL